MNGRQDTLHWRKSSRSSAGACVEVAPQPGSILVRDSKDPGGAVLTFDRATFAAFLTGITTGAFDPAH